MENKLEFYFQIVLHRIYLNLQNPAARFSLSLKCDSNQYQFTNKPKATKEIIIDEKIGITTEMTTNNNVFLPKILTFEAFLIYSNNKMKNIGIYEIDLGNYVKGCDEIEILMEKSSEYKTKLIIRLESKILSENQSPTFNTHQIVKGNKDEWIEIKKNETPINRPKYKNTGRSLTPNPSPSTIKNLNSSQLVAIGMAYSSGIKKKNQENKESLSKSMINIKVSDPIPGKNISKTPTTLRSKEKNEILSELKKFDFLSPKNFEELKLRSDRNIRDNDSDREQSVEIIRSVQKIKSEKVIELNNLIKIVKEKKSIDISNTNTNKIPSQKNIYKEELKNFKNQISVIKNEISETKSAFLDKKEQNLHKCENVNLLKNELENKYKSLLEFKKKYDENNEKFNYISIKINDYNNETEIIKNKIKEEKYNQSVLFTNKKSLIQTVNELNIELKDFEKESIEKNNLNSENLRKITEENLIKSKENENLINYLNEIIKEKEEIYSKIIDKKKIEESRDVMRKAIFLKDEKIIEIEKEKKNLEKILSEIKTKKAHILDAVFEVNNAELMEDFEKFLIQ